ncbi:hypothetical protein AB4K20DRAFT_1862785 [Rhizopus microsporus]|uniref:Uncharacterized protein n=1 Tax=Rhizopus microsporus TaxID=58291 RepID=A0A1X0RMT5_RHIZD|nr:hypothetical protein BCV71DRAFT_239366 [Rhizopus microsporus]
MPLAVVLSKTLAIYSNFSVSFSITSISSTLSIDTVPMPVIIYDTLSVCMIKRVILELVILNPVEQFWKNTTYSIMNRKAEVQFRIQDSSCCFFSIVPSKQNMEIILGIDWLFECKSLDGPRFQGFYLMLKRIFESTINQRVHHSTYGGRYKREGTAIYWRSWSISRGGLLLLRFRDLNQTQSQMFHHSGSWNPSARKFITDNGSNFVSEVIKLTRARLNTKKVEASVGHP